MFRAKFFIKFYFFLIGKYSFLIELADIYIICIQVVCIKFSDCKKSRNNQPIYFAQNQPNYYIIDSYMNEDGFLNEETNVVIDCLVESSNRFKPQVDIKWMKDTFDHNQFSLKAQSLLETNKDVLQNGSLKLTYKTKIPAKNYAVNHLLLQISSFRCLASDSFGKILSRPYKIFRFIIDRKYKFLAF